MLVLATAALGSLSNSSFAQGTRACESAWTTVQLTTNTREPTYVESARAVLSEGLIYLVGTPAFLGGSIQSVDSLPLIGAVVGPDGRATTLRGPASTAPMIRPLPVRDSAGNLHLLWAQSATAGDVSTANSLWHSELRRGTWTNPRILFQARRVRWFPGFSAAMASGMDLHVISTFRSDSSGGLVYVRRLRGAWRATPVNIRGLPSELNARMIARDSMAVVFIATDPTAGVANGSHVFLSIVNTEDSFASAPIVARPLGRFGVAGVPGARAATQRQVPIV